MTAAPVTADLADLLAAAPRTLPHSLDVTARTADGEVRLRLLTADPLEGEREGPDHVLVERAGETIRYVDRGWAEWQLDDTPTAEGWGAVLAGVVGQDVEGWTAAEGWVPFSIGVLVDLAEAEDGPLGFPDVPVVLPPSPRPAEGCAACAGEVLRPPYTPAPTIESMCADHLRAHDAWVSENLPEPDPETEGQSTLFSLILAMDTLFVDGLGAGLRAVEQGRASDADLLRRARTWFDAPGGLSPVYLDDDDLAGALHDATAAIARAEGEAAGLAALDDLRFLVPEACWWADVDGLDLLADEPDRAEALLRHLVEDHDEVPAAIAAAAEAHEERGEAERAADLYRMAFVRGIAAGDEDAAQTGEDGLRRLGLEPPMPTAKVGRNDPCPCGSGKKFKRCCGR